MAGLTEAEERAVEAAAEAIRAYERGGSAHRGRHAFEGAADEVLQEALGPEADVWAWARLARKALRRAQGGEPEPPEPKNMAEQGGLPQYGKAGGQGHASPLRPTTREEVSERTAARC